MRPIYIAVCGFLLTGTASAWETECKVDAFKDEDVCTITHYMIDWGGESTTGFVLMGYTDDRQNLAFSLGLNDAEGYVVDNAPFIIRVDENDAIDMKGLGLFSSEVSHGTVYIAGPEKGTALIRELLGGRSMKLRLGTSEGYEDFETSLDSFRSAWEEFASKSTLDWVKAIAPEDYPRASNTSPSSPPDESPPELEDWCSALIDDKATTSLAELVKTCKAERPYEECRKCLRIP